MEKRIITDPLPHIKIHPAVFAFRQLGLKRKEGKKEKRNLNDYFFSKKKNVELRYAI